MEKLALAKKVAVMLSVSHEVGSAIVEIAEKLYIGRMKERFSGLRVTERLKRTNPFLLRIRGAKTVAEWASIQVQGALYASEEEAVGHLLEAIAKLCHPYAKAPEFVDDLDFEVIEGEFVKGYQIKMSWDCMPMSSRKNLSNTIRKLKEYYGTQGKQFVGFFAPCYGRTVTSSPPGQEYISLASREFWQEVGSGDENFDYKVGEVCALLCSEFRELISTTLIPELITNLALAANSEIGDSLGNLDYQKLFRKINGSRAPRVR